jgi:hypothetical protein
MYQVDQFHKFFGKPLDDHPEKIVIAIAEHPDAESDLGDNSKTNQFPIDCFTVIA